MNMEINNSIYYCLQGISPTQANFNDYVSRQLKNNAYMMGRLCDYMSRVKGELKLTSKHVSMVTTQAEQVPSGVM